MALLDLLLYIISVPDIAHMHARIWGFLLLALFLGVLCNQQFYRTLLGNLNQHYPFILLSGILAVAGGIVSSVFHNEWDTYWMTLITILGWISLIYGGVAIIYPQAIAKGAELVANTGRLFLTTLSILGILVGAYLAFISFEHTNTGFNEPLPEEISYLTP